MKKNISINISGIIFHIEEDGYETLRRYLDSINSYFGSFEDSNEILADIESRIAEIFLARLNDGKQVVTAEDVATLINTMGNVSDFKAAEEQEFASGGNREQQNQTRFSNEAASNANKRLFRDEKRKILGGVCAGLAHYFNIDPVWPRLLFALLVLGSYGGLLLVYIILWVALPVSRELDDQPSVKKMFRDPEKKVIGGVGAGVAAFFGVDIAITRLVFVLLSFLGGLGIALYIILWIALPEAKSITEKMQMQGEPVTLSNIESTVKRGLNEKDTAEESTLAKIVLFPFRLIAMIINGLVNALGPLFKVAVDVLRIAIGVIITLLGVALVISIILSFSIVMGLFHAPDWMVLNELNMQASNLPLQAFRNSFPLWMTLSAFVTVLIPCLFIVLLGNSIVAKRIVFNSYVGWTLFVLFFISVIFVGVAIPRTVYAFKEEGEVKEEQVFALDKRTPVLAVNEMGLDDYQVTDLTLRGYEGNELKLVKRFRAQGSSRKIAGDNARMITYEVKQADSIIYFDSNIVFKNDAIFRAQRLDMDLYIPYGQKLVIQEQMWRLIDNFSPRGYRYNGYRYSDYYDSNNQVWEMTRDGLKCVNCNKDDEQAEDAFKGTATIDSDYPLSEFNALRLRGIFDVKVERGAQYGIKVTGPTSARAFYEVYVDGETLVIDFEKQDRFFWKNYSDATKLKLLITMPSLHELNGKGAGTIDLHGFSEDDIDIDLTGAINVDGELNARNVSAKLTGASSLQLSGEGDWLEADLAGASALKAYAYEVENASIEAHGASSAKVNVTNKLDVNKGVASSVTNRGNANEEDEY